MTNKVYVIQNYTVNHYWQVAISWDIILIISKHYVPLSQLALC